MHFGTLTLQPTSPANAAARACADAETRTQRSVQNALSSQLEGVLSINGLVVEIAALIIVLVLVLVIGGGTGL